MQKAWGNFKEKYISTLQKDAVTNAQQRTYFQDLTNDFDAIGRISLAQGIGLGNRFFEEQFRINGLTDEQQDLILRDQLGIYRDKVQQLYVNDVQDQLSKSSNFQKTLDGFDRFLSAYANVAVSTSYNTFIHDIQALNFILGRKYSLGDLTYPKDPVKVKWVLRETVLNHSEQCLQLAQGEDGDGIWDAQVLAELQIFPASSRLDCGGNCRCHLSPIVPTPEASSFLNKLIEIGAQRDVLTVEPNMTPNAFRQLFIDKGYIIPEGILDDWLKNAPYFRRSEFYRNLPNLAYNKKGDLVAGIKIEAVAYDVPAAPSSNTFSIKKFEPPVGIYMKIPLGPGETIDNLTDAQLAKIRATFSHEIGHLVAYVSDNNTIVSSVIEKKFAADFMYIADRQRAQALNQLQTDLDKVFNSISSADKTDPRVQITIKVLKEFFDNPDNFLERLVDAINKKKQFAGLDPKEVYRLFERTISTSSPNSFILSAYQLKDSEEFFAEWFSVLLTNPEKAALYNPSLNKMVNNRMTDFFESVITRRSKSLLPSAASVTLRSDIPLGGSFEPLAPNLVYKFANDKFTTTTKTLSKTLLTTQLREVFDTSPNLLRNEFFKDLDVTFVSRVSMGTRAGTRSALGYFENGKFVVNADMWKTLSVEQRSSTIADIVSQHVWESNGFIRDQVAKSYKGYLIYALTDLRKKVGIIDLDGDPIYSIITTVNGPPTNISYWMRNFEAFKPFIKNVADLPILDIDSLASPQMFLRSWFRMYVTKPQIATYYNTELVGTIKDYLRVSQVK